MITRFDSDSRATMILESTFDYKKDRTTYGLDDKCISYDKQHRMCKSTKIWKLKVLWVDGTTEIVSLKAFKESNPMDDVEFLKSRGADR